MHSGVRQSNSSVSGRPRILLTDTNRWPLGPRLAMGLTGMDCDVFVVCPSPGHPATKTSAVRQTLAYSGREPLSSLRRAIESVNPDVILPLCDRSVRHLHELHAIESSLHKEGSKLSQLIEHSLGPADSFDVVASRYQLLRLAASEGICVPDMIAIDSAAELELWCAQMPPPWVIKADGTWGGRGVRLAKTIDEARNDWFELSQRPGPIELIKRLSLNRDRSWILSDWSRSRPRVLVQSYIHGRPANCAVVCWQGKLLAGIAVEVIQAQGPTEPAMVVEVVEGAEMLRAARVIAERLHLSGFFGLDFMIEEGTGLAYLIEMNPRCTPPCPMPLGPGRDLVAALRAQLTGSPLRERKPATDKNRIAYFPGNWGNSVLSSDTIPKDTTYYDVPEGEPQLVDELLRPWSARSLLGQSIDSMRKMIVRPKPATSYIFERSTSDADRESRSVVHR
jgi:hypothetical protein